MTAAATEYQPLTGGDVADAAGDHLVGATLRSLGQGELKLMVRRGRLYAVEPETGEVWEVFVDAKTVVGVDGRRWLAEVSS